MSEEPLRIALTSYYLPSESKIGAGYMAHRLANALVDIGHVVTMYSPCERPSDARYRHMRVELHGHWRTVLRWPVALRKQDWSEYDAILPQGDDHLLRRESVPDAWVRTMHGSCLDEAFHVPRIREKARMAVLGLSEVVSSVRTPAVVGVSEVSLRYFPWCKTVIPNGIDTSLFRPDGPEPREANPTILFVGTYRNRKRGAFLQRVFADTVQPVLPDARLWMVADDAPTAPGVTVLGRIGDEELAALYRRAWVLCLPSTYEGFGVPYAEALVSGLPVVATPNCGAREVLQDGARGVLARDEELGFALVRLLQDEPRRAALSQLGVAARSEYAICGVAQRYEALIKSMMGFVPSGLT